MLVVGLFPVFRYYTEMLVNAFVSFCGHVRLFLLGKYLGIGIVGSWKLPHSSPKWLKVFTLLSAVYEI